MNTERKGDYMTDIEEERHLNMTIKVLKEQVEVFTSRLEPHDTGHLHTAISVLNSRIDEMMLALVHMSN